MSQYRRRLGELSITVPCGEVFICLHSPGTPCNMDSRRGRGTTTCVAHILVSEREDDPLMMRRRSFVAMAAATGTSLVAPAQAFVQAEANPATPMKETTPQTGYAPVNGLRMYYEIHGSGEPLVLLHGAFGAIDLWGPILTTLAETHQVIAVELQGHGHTADIIDRPLGYEQMADDVAALLEHLGIEKADLVGYSMGGTTGLQLAIRHPDLVRKLVAVSPNYRSDGYYPELLAGLQQLTPAIFAG